MSSQNMDTRTRILEATWGLMEQNRGQGVSMGAVAKAAGISRQAVYLHFASRTELMVATTRYVDEVKGLAQRLVTLEQAGNGEQLLAACVEVWGNYIPEIFGVAKALLNSRDTDEATAAAWNASMGCLRDVCGQAVAMLQEEGRLAPVWSTETATDLFWTLLSIGTWEQLTAECGWSTALYVERMQVLLQRTLLA